MKNFNEEKLFVAKIMGFGQDLTWAELYKKLCESILPFEEWMDACDDDAWSSLKAMILLHAVHYFTFHDHSGYWTSGDYKKARTELNKAAASLLEEGHLEYSCYVDSRWFVNDTFVEMYLDILKRKQK